VIRLLPEVPGAGRLGRHVEHDEASRAFPAARAPELVTRLHVRHGGVYDQGDLGSCTGNAMAGLLMTEPFWRKGRKLAEPDAIHLYEWATRLDAIPGAYPPDDTGSSGLAVAKAARQAGLIASYRHAFGLDHALAALVLAPVIVGVGWYEGFDRPGPHGLLTIAGDERGAHELELNHIDVERRLVGGFQSWGPAWGDRGRFCWTWDTFGRLLDEQGDVTTVAA
jgi:hypothetical protein